MNNNLKIGIIGAGIQGISNALFLQKKDLRSLFLIEKTPAAQQHLMAMQVIFLHMLVY